MFLKKYADTFLLFGSLALLIMWVNEFIYKSATFKDSYFFLMFALAGFLFYTYRKGLAKQKENLDKKEDASKPIIKATIGGGSNKKKKKNRK